MKIRNIAISFAVLSVLAACSTNQQRVDYKTGANQVPPLEIPPDLTAVTTNDQYSIPGGDGALVANFSDYSKSISGQSGKGANSNAVLPPLTNMRLERNGMLHWIVVEDKAENVWPGIKAFWVQLGFKIPVENPPAGVMETDWAENHGNVPRSYVRQVAGNGKAVDSLKSEGIRDQYVTRIERSKDGLNTEIHISRQVMQESQSGNRKELKWIPHENDPEIEIAVLQMLMNKLATDPVPVAAKTTGIAASSVPATPAPVAISEVLATVSVQLKDSATGKVIQINESFDRSWRRVGLALDSAHIVTTDKDRSKGIYFVAPVSDKGKKDSKKQQNDYQVTVRESQDGSEVVVVNQNGKSDEESARLVEILYQNMGTNPPKEIRSAPVEKSGSRSGNAVRDSR
jgi:outer membrane protein assembly factor BamC